MFSIMHISDLHRSSRDPIANDTLVAALLADRDRYSIETPEIRRPDAIVVSGDLIQGATACDDHRAELNRQYEITHDLLDKLTDRFVEGDRRRVAIVPGNHDCCWNTARSTMSTVETDKEPANIESALHAADSPYRWSWEDRRLYEIRDGDAYRRRFDAYWGFVERFYRSADLPHPIDRERGFNLFELDDGRVLIAGFESLHGNDCFSARGAIVDGIVSRCDLALRDARNRCRLRVAVWHHSIYGPPERMDYMDVRAVYEMIGVGFRIGLHGHQHYAETAVHYLHQPDAAMAVVGAGSLCAGGRELPRGIDRQYNIVVLNDEYNGASVHVREMGLGNQFSRTRRGAFGIDGTVALEWTLPVDAMGRTIDPALTADTETVGAAESALRAGDALRALAVLEHTDLARGSYARRLYLRAAQIAEQWELVVRTVEVPESADELVALARALEVRKDVRRARDAIARHSDRVGLAAQVRGDLEERLEVLEMMEADKWPRS